MENQISNWLCSELKTYTRNNTHTARIFEGLQGFRENEESCDVKLALEDGTIVRAHKLILASASPVFLAMFTNFKEKTEDCVIMKELDSTALELIIDYIYTGQIIITKENVQVLLSASNLLQMSDIQEICCNVLQSQLLPTNCWDIMALADFHNCYELLSSAKTYINHNFCEAVKSDVFLSVSYERVVEVISSDELNISTEEKVYECIVCWVNHAPSSREELFPKLFEHVRLPFLTSEYLLKTVAVEPLVQNRTECLNYVVKALTIKNNELETIPNTVFITPRRPVHAQKISFYCDLFHYHNLLINPTQQVILLIGTSNFGCYDLANNHWQTCQSISPIYNKSAACAVLKDGRLFALGQLSNSNLVSNKVSKMNLPTEHINYWLLSVPMLFKRLNLGIAVLNNCIYAVGGYDDKKYLKSSEVFNCTTKKWTRISCMSTRRSYVGVGVLDDLIYAVGGKNYRQYLKSVECYNPINNTWTSVKDMCVGRYGAGVGSLNGYLYVVGGANGETVYKSVEVYSPITGLWTRVADMHKCRKHAGVVAYNGLLYVVGGYNGNNGLDTRNMKNWMPYIEVYDPNTNTWSLLSSSIHGVRSIGIGIIDKIHFDS